MSGYKKQDKDIQSVELLVVQTDSNEQRMTETKIRVVDWVVNGKHFPQLEKREFFASDNGMKMGKAKGFSLKNLEVIQDHWGEIMTALGSRVPESQQGPAASVQPMVEEPVREQEF